MLKFQGTAISGGILCYRYFKERSIFALRDSVDAFEFFYRALASYLGTLFSDMVHSKAHGANHILNSSDSSLNNTQKALYVEDCPE